LTQRRINIGKQGEIWAKEYLQQHQYVIVEKNFRCKFGEIDLIAKDRHMIVFVEVRTKTSTAYGPAYNSVTSSKQKQVKRVALFYISKHNLVTTQFRFDVIGIILDPQTGQHHVDHIQNAF
jgi:putative endonuclease